VFEGLDTYATVFVNDRKSLASNMFRIWRVDCKVLLKDGRCVRIVFSLSVNEIRQHGEKELSVAGAHDQGKDIAVHAKAPYHTAGWGPRLLQVESEADIWRRGRGTPG